MQNQNRNRWQQENDRRSQGFQNSPGSRRGGEDWRAYERTHEQDGISSGGGYGQQDYDGGRIQTGWSNESRDFGPTARQDWGDRVDSTWRGYDAPEEGRRSGSMGMGSRQSGYGYGPGYESGYGSSYGSRSGGSTMSEGQGFGGGSFENSSGRRGQGQFSGRGPKGYRRSDERIKEEVCEALTSDHDVDASEIEVSVSEGLVTLKGTVEDRQTKRMAEECAERVSGVIDVQNELRVQSSRQASGSTKDETSSSMKDDLSASARSRSGKTSESSSKNIQ